MNSTDFRQTAYNRPFIPQRADPYILHRDGRYYFTASVPEYDRIVLRRSDTLEGLASAPESIIWTRHPDGPMSIHIWAPEIHYLDGNWYIYFAAGRQENKWKIRPYVLKCAGQDPVSDPWEEMGMLEAADRFSFKDFSLDMTVFEYRERRFAVWAEKVGTGKKISNLYIAEMASPVRLLTPRVLLSYPCYDWERVDFWVNEGPAFLARGEKVHLTYSASATGACYCMGMLSASASADLLDPNAWTKSRHPVLKTSAAAGMYGPGHNSFFKDDSGETVMAYHARPYDKITGDPLYDPNRHCYLMKLDWRGDRPVFSYRNNLLPASD